MEKVKEGGMEGDEDREGRERGRRQGNGGWKRRGREGLSIPSGKHHFHDKITLLQDNSRSHNASVS